MTRPLVMNDPALEFDEASHIYKLGDRELPSVTRILADQGVSDFTGAWFNEAAMARGRAVHLAIALDVEGDLDETTLDPLLVPYLEGWRRFVAESGAIIEHWERTICDPELGYAGTLDGIVLLPREPRMLHTVLDIKPAIYPSVGPQTAAYLRCARALYPRPGQFNRAALVIPGNGSYSLVPLADRADEAVFLAALRLYHFRRAHGLAAA